MSDNNNTVYVNVPIRIADALRAGKAQAGRLAMPLTAAILKQLTAAERDLLDGYAFVSGPAGLASHANRASITLTAEQPTADEAGLVLAVQALAVEKRAEDEKRAKVEVERQREHAEETVKLIEQMKTDPNGFIRFDRSDVLWRGREQNPEYKAVIETYVLPLLRQYQAEAKTARARIEAEKLEAAEEDAAHPPAGRGARHHEPAPAAGGRTAAAG